MKYGRNDPCWCGSGKKYKRCHLGREKLPTPTEGQLQEQHRQHFTARTCLHPDAPAGCDKVVRAHTLQRATLLKNIVDGNNHVLTFYPQQNGPDGLPLVQERGWRNASTFTGFCNYHDHRLFGPLEKGQFTGGDEQCFLVGYRAVCHELYQKAAAHSTAPMYRDHLDRGFSPEDQREIQGHIALLEAGTRKGLQDIGEMKKVYDAALGSGDFSDLNRCIVYFDRPPDVVSTGLVHADFDIEGNRLQDLGDLTKMMQGVAFGMAATPDGGAAVFSWPRTYAASERFVSSVLAVDADRLPSVLVQFLFLCIENTFFSRAWWDGLDQAQQQLIRKLMNTVVRAGPTAYSDDKLVDWKVRSIVRPR